MARLPWLIRTCFLSPYEILNIAQENKDIRKFSDFIKKLCCVYSLELIKAILNIPLLSRNSNKAQLFEANNVVS